ncbi:MAG TPA: hydrogenase 2 operon protein HybA [Candidatus Deferrimicrobiaceae bacterium]|jgi:Fe-S-cluster-containing dehydrogenase component
MSAGLTRRELLRLACIGSAAAAVAPVETATAAVHSEKPQAAPGAVGMLYDATVCTGCKACMAACNQVNELPADSAGSGGLYHAPLDLNSKTKNIIKLYQAPNAGKWSFVKRQCMHCLDPACVSGCPFEALSKDPEKGVVRWDGSRCIGCRYCEIACPFQIPKFEWDKWNPRIVKCEFCITQRLEKGEQPGCTGACPTGAVIFGKRDALLAEAKRRIAASPGKYFENRVYGEKDAGGTQVFYLAAVPFKDLGLPELGTDSIPYYATKVNAKLYKWLSGPLVLYGILALAVNRNWKHHRHEQEQHEAKGGLPEQL